MTNKVGRPLKYATAEDMKRVCDMYFNECLEKDEPMTVAGLRVALDICRVTFDAYANGDYDEQGNFSATVKKAREFIEADKLKNSLKGKYNATIAIFDLKNNHGYTDKIQNEHTGQDGQAMRLKVSGQELSDDQVKQIAEVMRRGNNGQSE